MKRSIKSIITLCLIALVYFGCTNDDSIIDQVDNNVERGAILRTISVSPLNLDLRTPDNIWSVEVEMEDNNEGALLDKVEVYVTFFDNTPENGTVTIDRTLLSTISANEFMNGPNNLPRGSLDLSLNDIVDSFGFSDGQYEGGDVFRVELELNLTDGRVFTQDDVNGGVAGGSFFQSPYSYRLTVVGCPPRPGTYTIEMTDAFGDGWQSTNADSGPGITITADGVLLAEVGICTDYDDTQDDWCSGGGSSGTATVEIPDGVEDIVWYFPGDFWGEMGFTVFGPDGQELYNAGAGSQGEGEFYVVLCRIDD